MGGGEEGEEDLEKTPQQFSSKATEYYTPMSEGPGEVPQIVIKPNTPRKDDTSLDTPKKGNISLNSDQAEVSGFYRYHNVDHKFTEGRVGLQLTFV